MPKRIGRLITLVPGAFLGALTIIGGVGSVPSDALRFYFVVLWITLALKLASKTVAREPVSVRDFARRTVSRKSLIHRNDPLLM